MADFKERFLLLKKEKNNISLEKLAEAFNTTKFSLSRMVNGHLSVKKETLQIMAEYFDVSIDYLLGNTDIRTPACQKQKPPEILEKINKLHKEQMDTIMDMINMYNEKNKKN